MTIIRLASRIVTWAALGGACACAVVWWATGADLEPAVNALVLISAISGLFVERWANRVHKKRDLVHAVAHELLVNDRILRDPVFDKNEPVPEKPRALPHVVSGVVEAALSSGVFSDGDDSELFRRLHLWRVRAEHLNRRLSNTEARTFSEPASTAERIEELRFGRTLKWAKRELEGVLGLLRHRYPRDMNLGSATASFLDPPEPSPATDWSVVYPPRPQATGGTSENA